MSIACVISLFHRFMGEYGIVAAENGNEVILPHSDCSLCDAPVVDFGGGVKFYRLLV